MTIMTMILKQNTMMVSNFLDDDFLLMTKMMMITFMIFLVTAMSLLLHIIIKKAGNYWTGNIKLYQNPCRCCYCSISFTRFIIVNAQVPSGSMENTILTGDRLIGFRLAYLFHEPERGDIVIFKYPDDESQNFVKRVIGIIVMSFRFPTDMYMSMVNSLKRIIFGSQ